MHVAFLFAAVALVWWTDRSGKESGSGHVKRPETRSFANQKPDEREVLAWQWRSPVTLWFALQALGSAVVTGAMDERFPLAAIGIALLGAMLTILACYAWLRIQKTFMAFLWSYCAVNSGPELADACAASDPI